MIQGHRVERFRFKEARTVREHAPWAEMVVRVGPSLFVAYEAKQDAQEEHGPVVMRVSAPPPFEWNKIQIGRARRVRGDLVFRCPRCLEDKPDSAFWRDGCKSPRKAHCATCAAKSQRIRRAEKRLGRVA